jgi:WD40 repeat protein
VLLYGDSGSGKSSLVNAGLIPEAIELGFTPERLRVQPRASEELVVERIHSADDDEEELLPSALALDDSSTRTVLAMDAFSERVRTASERHRLLLIFDQFEEIVTLFDEAGTRDAQRRLVELLVRLLRGPLPVKILLSFREDYLGRVKELLSACPELIDQALRITPPAAEALPTIIRGPFKRYPGHFSRELSPALADRLVTVLAERFGTGDISLSEVQTVCLRLWQSDDPEALLTEKGPQGLLEDYLGEALDRMPTQRRAAAIALLAQMVTSAGTRNVISAGDLVQRVREQEGRMTPSQLEDALEGLSQSRLVRRERRRDLDLYEITSEFLVPWISRRRDGLRKSQDRRRERGRLFVIGAIAAVLVLTAAIVALLFVESQQRTLSEKEARLATAAALASDAQVNSQKAPDIALLLSLAALAPNAGAPEDVARGDMIEALEETQLKGVVGILHGDSGPVDSVAFSADGRTLASGSQDGTARLWDVATHTQLGAPIAANGLPVTSVAFSPDGRTLAVGGDYGMVQLWNVASHGPAGSPLAAKSDTNVVFSPDGRMLATASQDGTVQLWNPATGQPVGAPLAAGPSPVTSIAISGDGLLLADGAQNGTVRLWNIADPARPIPLGQPLTAGAGSVTSLAFSPDGRLLATARQDGTVRLWDVAGQRQFGSPLTVGASFVNSVAFSPDGRTLAGGGEDGAVRLWDAATHRLLGSLATASLGSVDSVAFSPDDRTLASGSSDGTVELWDLATAKQPGSTLTAGAKVGSYTSVAFSPGGDVLAAGGRDGAVRLWDAAHRLLGSLPTGSVVDSVAFSPDGRMLASGSGNGTILLWNAATHRLLGSLVTGSARPVTSVAFSTHGSMLASASQDGMVRLWDTATHKLLGSLMTGSAEPVNSVAFSTDGTLAAADQDGTVRLWNAAAGLQLGLHLITNAGPVTSVAFSPDGSMLASASEDGTVRLWDTATHKQLGSPLTGHTGPVTSVAFSPDGSMLASASQDGTVRLWDTATRVQLGLPLTANAGPLTSVAFSPDGGTLAAGGNETIWLGSGFLWHNFAQLSNQVCSLVGTGLSAAEWALYAPDLVYQDSCP